MDMNIDRDPDSGAGNPLDSVEKLAGDSSITLLQTGDIIRGNQNLHRIRILSPEAFELRLPGELSELERLACIEFAVVMRDECAPAVSRINYRLSDKGDGITFEGADLIARDLHELDPDFARELRGYFTLLRRNGGTLDLKRGCTIVPPLPRAEFENGICPLIEHSPEFPWGRLLDVLYEADPGLQGFYVFDDKAAKDRFYEILNERSEGKFCLNMNRLKDLFDSATSPGNMTAELWEEYEALSEAVHGMQEELITTICNREDKLRALCTRVRLCCDDNSPDGLLATPVHYLNEFSRELFELGETLKAAREVLPSWATGLHSVLDAQIEACARNTGKNWGKCLPEWVTCDDPGNIFDLNLTFEEACSTIGLKGSLLMVLSQFETIPEDLVRDLPGPEHKPNLHIVWLNTILVAGAASGFPMMGEKLPDADGQEHYKVQTFVNVTDELGIQSEAKQIAAATGVSVDEVKSWGRVPVNNVHLHEIGHTLGANAEFLGSLATQVEEMNAEARVIISTARSCTKDLRQAIQYSACWHPVFRAMQGAGGAHSAAEITLNWEYRQAGGLQISERLDGSAFVALLDESAVAKTAYEVSRRVLLWERGIPLSEQNSFAFPGLSATDREDRAAVRAAEEVVRELPPDTQEIWRKQVLTEVADYFSHDRVAERSAQLAPVVKSLPDAELILPVIPTDDNYRGLVRLS